MAGVDMVLDQDFFGETEVHQEFLGEGEGTPPRGIFCLGGEFVPELVEAFQKFFRGEGGHFIPW
jgi:hypothetical protein